MQPLPLGLRVAAHKTLERDPTPDCYSLDLPRGPDLGWFYNTTERTMKFTFLRVKIGLNTLSLHGECALGTERRHDMWSPDLRRLCNQIELVEWQVITS